LRNKPRKKKWLKSWSINSLSKLSDQAFIEVFINAISDRSIIKTGPLEFENKIKHGAPKGSIECLLKEAERRRIPLSTIAERFAKNAFSGNSFVSDLCAPSTWKRYEIHAAGSLLKILAHENVKFDTYVFDARVAGKITKTDRQVDLLIVRENPRHVVACEFRNYQKAPISIKDVEAFISKLEDIDANKGVMFTPLGYQSGAIASAQHYGIVLFKFWEVDANELKNLYPKEATVVNLDDKYWILERDDKTSWVFSGALTENARLKQI
jgi:hypothetical protein